MVGRLVSSPRGATYYWIEKNADAQAPWIIFTHGLCANHRLFDKQLPFFRLNYHVLLWDLPMHGRSRPYHAFTYAHAAEELKQITDREHIKQAILVGHGIGGYVCQEFASRWPEMVQAFVGVSAMPFGVALYPEFDQKELKKCRRRSSACRSVCCRQDWRASAHRRCTAIKMHCICLNR